MAIPISNVTRRQVYAPSGTGGIGPYAFTFEILANTDIAVFKDDTLLTLTTHYTVTINVNGTGSVTITAAGLALTPTSPTQYAVVGNRAISRATDFTTGGDFFANTLNDELDQQTIFAQQNAEGVTRALQAPQTDPTTIDMTLPRSSVRAGKVLSFDASGNPSATEFIGSNRGNWATGTLYFVRDIVKDTSTSNIFQITVEHTSVGAQPLTTNAEAAKYFLLVDAAAAGASATAAAASASAASTSASNASTSATNAASSASTASTQASNASTSATNASNSATAASSSATTASTAATNAGNSATAASTSATNASNSATSASGSASTATTQASNASTSATAAAGSASTATTQATNAASSASAASTSASNASTSASNASTSATAAAASAASAAASFDAFDDIYLGAKSSDPSVDNDGNALTTGDQYFNTTANELRVYNGSTWQAASTVGGTVTNLTVTNGASIHGLTVGRGAGAVATNTAVGASALAANTTGDTNTATGYQALTTNTSGTSNTAYGVQALRFNTTGGANASFGRGSLNSNTTGGSNVAIGENSLTSNTTASNNTAVGYQAAYSNVTGTNITAIGRGALYNNTANNNTAVGLSAGFSNTTGNANVFIGSESGASGLAAGYLNTTGSSNTAIGSNALSNNTTASDNTAVGYQAGYNKTTGSYNTFLGSAAGYGSAAVTGRWNTIVGYASGFSLTTGEGNTFVGSPGLAGAGYYMTTGSKNTILGGYTGNNGGLDIRTASNYIVLSDGDGNPRQVIDASGNVGIGTSSPAAVGTYRVLDLNHTTGGYLSLSAGGSRVGTVYANATATGLEALGARYIQFLTNNTERARIDSSGNLLVGATTSTAGYSGYKVLIGGVGSPILKFQSTTGPSAWDLYNNAGTTFIFSYNSSDKALINQSTGAYTALSDINKKKDFEPSTIGLAEVLQLQPKLFRMLDDADNAPKELGFIAQEVRSLIPQAYIEQEGNNGTFIGLQDRPIIAALTAAIQEQQTLITALTARITALEQA